MATRNAGKKGAQAKKAADARARKPSKPQPAIRPLSHPASRLGFHGLVVVSILM